MAGVNGAPGTEGVDVTNRLPEHRFVKEENGVQSLVLGAGRDITSAGQIGEEQFELLFAGKTIGHFTQRRHVATEPENVTIFCGKGFVLSADDFAHPADSL